MTLDLNRVATFVRVVEEGGFSAAARTLGLPKSSVSRAVALLEKELGARLLNRSTRSVRLTEAGHAFYTHAAHALAAVTEGREAVVELESELRGRIRITAPADAGALLVAPLIAEFSARHPCVTFEALVTGRMVDLVEEGVDLAFRAGRVHDESLIARRLAPHDFGLYASPAYVAAHGAPSAIADLVDHRCVVFHARDGVAQWRFACPAGEETIEVRGVVSAEDLSFLFHVVRAGAGIGLLPRYLAAPSVPHELVQVLPTYHTPGAVFYLAYPSARYVPRRVAAFRDFVIERLSHPPV